MSEIPNGLRADIMRKRILDKNTLRSNGSLLFQNQILEVPSALAKIQIRDKTLFIPNTIYFLSSKSSGWNYTVPRTLRADNAVAILSDEAWSVNSNPYMLQFEKRSTLILRTQYQTRTYETIIDWGELKLDEANIVYITYLTGYGHCYLGLDAYERDTPYYIIIPESLRKVLSIVGYKILY